MTAAPTASSSYAHDDVPIREESRRRKLLGLGLGFAGTSATLAAIFVPLVSGDDFRLGNDNWQLTVPMFVAVAAGFGAVFFMLRRPHPVAIGVLGGVGLIAAAYFGGWIANIKAFEEDPGIGAFLGLGGGILTGLGAVVLAVGERGDVGLAYHPHAGREFVSPRAEPVLEATRGPEPPPAPQPVERQPPPGWYPDPAERARLRYWTGTNWTENTQE